MSRIFNSQSTSSSSLPDNAIDRLSTLPPSSTGSLSSITTTSVASSEPGDSTLGDENHRHKHHADATGRRGGGGGGSNCSDGGPGGDDYDEILAEKLAKNALPLKQEKWYETTLQVSIPFFLAGIGTIGAGIILGRVEVSVDRVCDEYEFRSEFIHPFRPPRTALEGVCTRRRTLHSRAQSVGLERQPGHVFGIPTLNAGQLGEHGLDARGAQDDCGEHSPGADPSDSRLLLCGHLCHLRGRLHQRSGIPVRSCYAGDRLGHVHGNVCEFCSR